MASESNQTVRFAQAHGMKVRGHGLVWGRSNPDWLTEGHFTTRQLSRLPHEHIDRVMRYYAGEVFAGDAVNEALDENGNVRSSIWYNKPGAGFSKHGRNCIEQAFRWAHKADPHALLFYNEAEGEGLNRKSNAIYSMVKNFRRRGVPIKGVGLQMHIPKLDADVPAIAANIARLTALGVQVHITELDVSLPLDSGGQVRADDLTRQADVYRGIARVCLNSAGCTAIQTWGFIDKYSWIGSHSRGTRGQALPFDRSYRPKAAYRALWEESLGGRVPGH
jgi:endo-1,4-beta-xylanase